MKHRITGIIIAAALALAGSLAARAESICGKRTADHYVACIPAEEMRKHIQFFIGPDRTQVWVKVFREDTIHVRVTAADGSAQTKLVESTFVDGDGEKAGMVQFDGLDWRRVEILRR